LGIDQIIVFDWKSLNFEKWFWIFRFCEITNLPWKWKFQVNESREDVKKYCNKKESANQN
jgi:hypothetical protein